MTEDARILVRRYIDRVWNGGDAAALEELTLPDFTYSLGGQPPRDRTGMAQFLRETRAAFPDWRVETDDLIVEGDLAAVRWHGRVTHTGPFRGVPATGRRIDVSGINVYRVSNGRIAAEWEQTDSLGMLLQLGVGRAG
jgi:steroid delta-isomerase-like uncharacterized protein